MDPCDCGVCCMGFVSINRTCCNHAVCCSGCKCKLLSNNDESKVGKLHWAALYIAWMWGVLFQQSDGRLRFLCVPQHENFSVDITSDSEWIIGVLLWMTVRHFQKILWCFTVTSCKYLSLVTELCCSALLDWSHVASVCVAVHLCLYVAVYISLLIPVTHEGRFSLSAVSDSWWCSSVGPDIRPERWPQTHPSLTWLLFLSRLTFWGKVPPRVPYISPTWPVHSPPTPLRFWPEQTLFTSWLWVSENVCVGVCFGAAGPEEG